MVLSLKQYAIIFIILYITLCIHIFLSILRRNIEQIINGVSSTASVIPVTVVNIIYFFIIKPNEVLSVSINFPIGTFARIAIFHGCYYVFAIRAMKFIYFVSPLPRHVLNIVDIIFIIISIIDYFSLNVLNGNYGLSYILMCVIIFIYSRIFIYIDDRLF